MMRWRLAMVMVCALLAVSASAAPSADRPDGGAVPAGPVQPAQVGQAAEKSEAASAAVARFGTPLVCLWQHEPAVDITSVVHDLGFNTVWTDDPEYTGQRWEDTQMYHALQVPGIRYVIPKIDRAAWGWTQEGSLKTARWIAELSLQHKEIIGLYLNDFYDEIEEGDRTIDQWREIIAAAKSVNPKLDLWVPHYPHRSNEQRAYDFDYQGVVLNLWDSQNLADAEKHVATARAQHAGKLLIGSLYINRGGERRPHWLTEQQFKDTLTRFVDFINGGKLDGLRVYCACQLVQRPEYARWAKEVMGGLEKPAAR